MVSLRVDGMIASMLPRNLDAATYLDRERLAETKSEYVDGYVCAWSGIGRTHDHVSGDLFALMLQALRGSSCDVFSSDLRVQAGEADAFFYPDVTVLCGEPEWVEGHFDTLINPTLVAEVMTPSSEFFDRTQKARRYRQMPSLQAILLVSQNRPQVEVLERCGDVWQIRDVEGLDARLELPAIDCHLDLEGIYRRASRAWG